MKKTLLLVVAIVALAIWHVSAQVPQPGFGLISVSTAASCPTPTFTGTTLQGYLCMAPDGVYLMTVQSPAPVKLLSSAPTAPVTSVFGRTGPVVATEADYTGVLKYDDLASPPTTISCPTASLSSGSTGTFTASGCSIK